MVIAQTIENTMGAMYIGIIVSTILYGVSCIQTWHYYITYKRDSIWLKALVAGVWISDSVNVALVCAALYDYIIVNFANPAYLSYINRPIVVQVLFNGITAFLVQIFFAFRIWSLSHQKIILIVPVVILILGQFGANIGYTVFTLQIRNFSQSGKGWTGALDVTAAVTDTVISIILCGLLANSRSEYSQTNTMINKLILFSLNTGLVTTVCALAALLCYYVLPTTLIYVGVYLMLGRLYCNSLLATLNARQYIRNGGSSGGALSYSLDNRPPHVQNTNRNVNGGISVQIETMKETHGDDSRTSLELAQKAARLDV